LSGLEKSELGGESEAQATWQPALLYRSGTCRALKLCIFQVLDLKGRNSLTAANVEEVRCDVFQGAFEFAGGGSFGAKDHPQVKEQGDYNLKYLIAAANNIAQDYLPYPNYSGLGLITHGAWANYNDLLVAWNKREGSLTYALNYTFSKTMGIQDNSIDPINIHNDYVVSNSDRTHVLNASYAFEVGNRFRNNRLEGTILNGWMVSGITGLQSGPPISQSDGFNMGFGGTDATTDLGIPDPNNPGKLSTDFGTNSLKTVNYLGTPVYKMFPKLTCNPGKSLKSGQYVNPSCFSLPTAPQFDPTGVLTALGGNGPSHMPYFRGPAYFSSDPAASRTFRITGSQNAQIKFSATNFLNHALTSFDQSNSNNLNLNYTTGALQTTGSASGSTWVYGVPNEKFGRRVLEMSLRYNF
jgi:hypothetical protein